MSSFSAALASGQLGPLMGQFGLGEEVANAAAQGGKKLNTSGSFRVRSTNFQATFGLAYRYHTDIIHCVLTIIANLDS